MDKVTPEVYAANIPDCCSLRTFEDHTHIMLCWGLISQIERGTAAKDQNCGMCEFNTLISKEEYQAFWSNINRGE
jgi:hypothetical protein